MLKSLADRKRKYASNNTSSTTNAIEIDDDNNVQTSDAINILIPSVKTASERKTVINVSNVQKLVSSSSTIPTSSNVKKIKIKTRIGKAHLSWLFPITTNFEQVRLTCLYIYNIKQCFPFLIILFIYNYFIIFKQLQQRLLTISIKIPNSGLNFDGEALELDQCPKDYEMENNDIIDVKVCNIFIYIYRAERKCVCVSFAFLCDL